MPEESGVVIGIDIGGTKVALMVRDLATGEDLYRDRFATPQPAPPDDVIAQSWRRARELLEEDGRRAHEVRAMGVAVPGQVRDGHVIAAGNLGWTDVPLDDIVRRQVDVPVFVEHDANAGAIGEHWLGAARDIREFVFLSVGTGVGAGVVLDGKIHRGAHLAAGEVGDMVCDRGAFRSADRGGANLGELIGARKLHEIVESAVGEMSSLSEAVLASTRDERLRPFMDHLADLLAIAVINIAAVLDPEAVVLGGGTAAAGEPLLREVRARIESRLAAAPRLVLSALGEDAQLHGVIFGALETLKKRRAGEDS